MSLLLRLYRDKVRPEWTDYNGHMNEAFYVLVFGYATDALLDFVGMGPGYRERTATSAYTVESHINYLAEVREGVTILVETQVLAVDDKRLRLFHRLTDDNNRALATTDVLLLHVDRSGPRVSPFSPEVRAEIDKLLADQKDLPWPEQAGRRITLGER